MAKLLRRSAPIAARQGEGRSHFQTLDETLRPSGRRVTGRAGVVLDAGIFIAVERRQRPAVALTQLLVDSDTPLVTSAGVVAQVWRDGSGKQVPITYLLRHTNVVPLDYGTARLIGRVLGQTGSRDPIDAHVVLLARQRGWPVITSDPDDLLAIDPNLQVERI